MMNTNLSKVAKVKVIQLCGSKLYFSHHKFPPQIELSRSIAKCFFPVNNKVKILKIKEKGGPRKKGQKWVDLYSKNVYYMKLQKLSDEEKAETKYCPFRL
jgi:hypothetical protein